MLFEEDVDYFGKHIYVNIGSKQVIAVYLGYYDQEHHVLHMDKSIFEEISDDYPDLTGTQIRNTLAAFLFTGDDVFKPVHLLSGGEKDRGDPRRAAWHREMQQPQVHHQQRAHADRFPCHRQTARHHPLPLLRHGTRHQQGGNSVNCSANICTTR